MNLLAGRKAKVLALSFGKALTGIVTLASFSALSYMLPEKEDYAAFRQAIMAFMVITPFMTMGLGQGLYYFLPTENTRTRGRVLDALIIVITIGSIFAAFIFFGGNEILATRFSNPQVASLLLILIPLCFAHAITQLFAPILTIQNKIVSLTLFNITTRVLIGALTIAPVLIWVNPTAPLIGMTIGACITCLLGLALLFFSLPKDDWTPQKNAMKELVKFSLPLGIGGMVGALNVQLDKVIVSMMCSPEEFAVFSNGAIEIPLIGVLTGSIVAVLMVDMRKAVVENRHDEAIALFRKTAIQTSYVLFPVAIFLMIFADSFVSVMFSSRYEGSALPLRVYLLLIPIRTVSFGALLIALGKNNAILHVSLTTLLLNVTLSIALVFLVGPTGAVISTVATVLFWTVPVNLYVLSKSLGCGWFSLLPLSSYLATCTELVWFVVILVIVYWITLNQPHLYRLVLATVTAGTWMMYWWNGRLYSANKLSFKFESK